MKTVNKWYLLLPVLFLTFSCFAQNSAFDDDIFFSPRKYRDTKSEQNETKEAVAEQTVTMPVVTAAIPNTRNVDEYNRRFNGGDVYEEEIVEDDSFIEIIDASSPAERIIKFHNPAKIAIVNSDNVNIIPDGDGGFIIDFQQPQQSSVNVNVGLGWGWNSPWYDPWYDPWYNPYWSWNRPWRYGWYSWYSPWYNPWWSSSYNRPWNRPLSWGWTDSRSYYTIGNYGYSGRPSSSGAGSRNDVVPNRRSSTRDTNTGTRSSTNDPYGSSTRSSTRVSSNERAGSGVGSTGRRSTGSVEGGTANSSTTRSSSGTTTTRTPSTPSTSGSVPNSSTRSSSNGNVNNSSSSSSSRSSGSSSSGGSSGGRSSRR